MKSPWYALMALALVVVAFVAVSHAASRGKSHMTKPSPHHAAAADTAEHIVKSDAEWKKELSPEQYHVLREQGTELAFTGPYWNTHTAGKYLCAACGYELFGSAQKFDSGTGWPSFWQPAIASHVARGSGLSFDFAGHEVHCARCGGHLGHVFDDGPPPTGLRYCINSVSLQFVKAATPPWQ